MNDQGNIKAVEKSLADMAKPLPKTDRNFAPVDQRGNHELLAEVEQMLDVSLQTVRLALQRLDLFYKGGKP